MASSTISHDVIHAATASAKLLTSEEAVEAARNWGLFPQDAEIRSTRLETNRNRWIVAYTHRDEIGDFRDGTAELNASTGDLLYFTERMNFDRLFGDITAPPLDSAEQNISYSEAVAVAHEYASGQPWPFEHEWMKTVIPQSAYSLRDVSRELHVVPLDRAHRNGRYLGDSMNVYVNRITGEVAGHEIRWSHSSFIISEEIGTFQTAAAAKYEDFQPLLDWTEDNNKRLAYSFDRITDRLQDNEQSSLIPKYNKDLAKKRLLTLYEMELVYTRNSHGDAIARYDLVLKQDTPLFYNGAAPSIDANTGEWVDYLGSAIDEPIPSASEWLIDQAVPVGKTGYEAAVVWDNELLTLNNEPLVHNGSTLVPFRELLSKLGAKIGWDPVNRIVTGSKDGTTIELTIGSSIAYVNGQAHTLGAPAILQKGYTYIPARIVLETFGAKVDWDNDSRLVLVDTNSSLPKLTDLQLKQFRFQAYLNWAEKQ